MILKHKSFLNSFFSSKFTQNKAPQIKTIEKDLSTSWDGKKNLVFITHYVVISEILNYAIFIR